jgi:hypothetical protein
MRRAKALALVLLLASVVGVVMAAYVLGPWKFKFPVIIPVDIPVKVFATTSTGYLFNVTVNVNPGNYTVVTTGSWSDQPVLSLRVKQSYTVTASWQQASLTKTITVVQGSYCVIQVQVSTERMLIMRIDFWPYW